VKKACFLLIVGFLVIYLLPLGVRPMVIPDETRYAETPREMIATGDWVVPRLDGFHYFEKPVLGDWLNAVSMSLFGENAFAVRLPSALAVGISALLIFFLVNSFTGQWRQALLASAAFLTCFEVFGVGTFCVLDSVFSMLITATLVFFFFAWQGSVSSSGKNVFLVLSGVSCGLAFLAKGFLAFALPVMVLCPFLVLQREWKNLLRIWWLPLASAILVVLPWCLAIQIKEADFWSFFFWHEHIRRFLSPMSGQHHRPFWFFIPVMLAGALPWSAWLPNAVSGLRRIRFREPFVRFMVCWLVFPFVFFSASGGKVDTYILPCFPPLIILIIIGFRKWYALPGKEKKFTVNQYISSIFMVLLAAALVLCQAGAFGSFKIYRAGEEWKWLLVAAALLFYAMILFLSGRQADLNKRFVYCCLAPLAVMSCVPFAVPERVKAGKMPGGFLSQNSYRIHQDTILISDNYMTPAVCWFYKRSDVYLFGFTGEFEYGLSYKDAGSRLIDASGFEKFVQQHAGGEKIVLIATEKHYVGYKKELPPPLHEECGDGFVLAEYGPRIAPIGVTDAAKN
jgi:4-amino-4-deoxy-L-arabinose transferase